MHPRTILQEQATITLSTLTYAWDFALTPDTVTTNSNSFCGPALSPVTMSAAPALMKTLPRIGGDSLPAGHSNFEMMGNTDVVDGSIDCIQALGSVVEVPQVTVSQEPPTGLIRRRVPSLGPHNALAAQRAQVADNASRKPHASLIEASQEIIKIMTSFKVMPNQSLAQIIEGIERAMQGLSWYTLSLPVDVHAWVENKRRPCIGAPSARSHSTGRRNPIGRKGLYLCLWCAETITAKPNFSNHIRAHLNLHLSFCDYCDFSSVDVRLPRRHNCRKQRIGA